MERKRGRLGRASTIAVVLAVAGTSAHAEAPVSPAGVRCTASVAAASDGGTWPSVNGDLANSRHQRAEDRIGVADVDFLEPAWTFSAADLGITGAVRTTPVVAHGCVYLAFGQGYLGDRGDVVALEVASGRVVWHRRIDGSVLGLSVANGMVYVTPSRGTRGEVAAPVVTADYRPAGSFALALDARTGRTRWRSERLDDGDPANGTFVNASPVAFEVRGRNLLFVPLAGGAGDGARIPMYFLDARTGRTVRRAYSLTESEYAEGFGGTGIWSTAAFDPDTRHLYAGTADSDGHSRQHPYNNAILRIDADPTRPTFGKVVGHYTGTSEHADLDAYIGGEVNPICGSASDTPEVDPPTFFDTSASVVCLELDLDFGASPNLYRDSDGRRRVGALQKSGLYHSVDAATMTAVFTFPAGPGGAAMSSATAAIDRGRIMVGASPNIVHGIGRDTGEVSWTSTTDLDVFAYQPVTVANGVLYALSDSGFLLGLDATSGLPVLRRSVAMSGGFEQCLGVGAGVAVAHHTVFAPCDNGGTVDAARIEGTPGGLVAFRLPG